MNTQSYRLKEIANNVEELLKNIEEKRINIDNKIGEIKHTKYLCLEKIFSEKSEIFQQILEKYETKEEILKIMNYIFGSDIYFSVCGREIDFNNVDYDIFEEDIKELEQEIKYINGIKKLKLKELDMTKKYLNDLVIYKQYKFARPNISFDNYFIKNKDSIFKNVKNKKFVNQYLNYKYYKHKFQRCLINDEIKCQEYKIEQDNIQNCLIEAELELIEKQEKLDRTEVSKKELESIKDDRKFISFLKKFFILNFDHKHFIRLNKKDNTINSNFSFYYFHHKFIGNLFSSIDNELELLEKLHKTKWQFYKQVRCFQYHNKDKAYDYCYEQTKTEIDSYIKGINKKINFIYNFTNKCLSENKHVNVYEFEDFFNYISNKYKNLDVSYHKQIFINNSTQKVIDNIFTMNFYFINKISL